MNPRNSKLERFFEYDVAEAIPKLVKEHAMLAGFLDYEEADLLADSKIRVKNLDESSTTYVFMDEPYIEVTISDDFYSIKVADQSEERLFFRTTDIDAFIRYWNADIVGYFGQDVRFPEIKDI